MTVAMPIFLVSDKKLWVIDKIHNPHDNVRKQQWKVFYIKVAWNEFIKHQRQRQTKLKKTRKK